MASSSGHGVKNHIAHKRDELLSKCVAPENIEERVAERYVGPVGELNKWVDSVREATGETIPYFDPRAASDGMKVLMLQYRPPLVVEEESGFISPHNNDLGARNVYELCLETGLRYDDFLPWNIVPWALDSTKPPQPRRVEARRARPYLEEIIDLLPGDLAAVIVVGIKEARPAWEEAMRPSRPKVSNAEIHYTATPGPRGIIQTNKTTGRPYREHIAETFTEIADLVR